MDALFDVGNAFFKNVTVVDMDMADNRVFFFIHLDNPVEQFFDAEARFADGRDDRAAYHACQRFVIELVTGLFQFVVHVEGNHHLYVHIDQLGSQV